MTYEERKKQVQSFLGKCVQIEIDRPIGYVHTKGEKTLVYPINYGYVPGVFGGDGEELDVYLLGVDVPVEKADCRIVGIVHREDDVEDKLIGAPVGTNFSKEEMEAQVRFQEKYYHSRVEPLEDLSKELKALKEREHYSFEDLRRITEILRSPNGCPWDREQTHASIRTCMIEEAYEVAEGIDKNDPTLLCEELGDVLFQVLFHAQLESEDGRFEISDVIDGICRKMIHRHPHVFANDLPSDAEGVLRKWNEIKVEEKQRKTLSSRLTAIPPILPALLRAQKVGEKIGENRDAEEILKALKGEFNTLQTDVKPEEMGKILSEITRFCAKRGWNAEEILTFQTEKIIASACENEKKTEKK